MNKEEKLKKLAEQMQLQEYKGLSEEEIKQKEEEKEKIKARNIAILDNTLEFFSKSNNEHLKESNVYLEEDISLLRNNSTSVTLNSKNRSCAFSCQNIDTLSLTFEKFQKYKEKILVLNLASATNPGGKSRDGASAQEEDLCRRTSLLLSLEGDNAKKYYDYNKTKNSHLGTDAIILSPYVEVIKDTNFDMLSDPFTISVISCAAPMIRLGLEGLTQIEYEKLLYNRIEGIFLISASNGYKHLILGAFGCGVYGNDASIVAKIFMNVIKNFKYDGKKYFEIFESIDFAILCTQDNDYNYQEFNKVFTLE